MSSYNDTLRDLAEKMHEKESVAAKLKAARAQQVTLSEKAEQLKKRYQREAKDVAALEGRGVAALFYAAIGKKAERLEKERAEAFAAKAKYDAAMYEASAAQADVAYYQKQAEQLKEYEAAYQTCLAEKAAAIKASGSATGEALLGLEQTIAQAKHQQKELREATAAGDAALGTVGEILEHLESAEGWGTWDIMGGGMLADIAKHDHLDTAQRLVETLQGQLRRFQTELADVQINGDLQISIEGFLGFADFFFDGLFVDWAVMDKIESANTQVNQTKAEIVAVQGRLHSLQAQAQQAQADAERQRDALIVTA